MEEEKKVLENKSKKLYSFNYVPLLTDFFLRWIILWAWRVDYIGDVWFWVINIVIIPVIVCILLIIHSISNGFELFEVDIRNTTVSILASLLIIISGTFITFHLYENIHALWKILISFITFLVYSYYVFVLNLTSARKPIDKKASLTTKKPQIQNSESIESSNDLNDIDLVRLEGVLNYTNDRVNSYILESALFSGLAFAGFISLITSDKLKVSDISVLLERIKDVLSSIVFFDLTIAQ